MIDTAAVSGFNKDLQPLEWQARSLIDNLLSLNNAAETQSVGCGMTRGTSPGLPGAYT